MDIIVYLKPLIKWWWLLVIATLLAAGTSFAVTIRQPKMYQSQTLLMIGRTTSELNPTPGDFYLEQQLASYYADIANREVVRNGVMKALGMYWLPPYTAHPLPNTQLIEIDVTDAVPQRAQAVANELAHQLILQSPSSDRPENKTGKNLLISS